MIVCPRLIISDCTLRIFRGYDFRIFKILIDILGLLTQTFESAAPVCLVMECPLGAIIRKQRAISVPRGEGHTSIL